VVPEESVVEEALARSEADAPSAVMGSVTQSKTEEMPSQAEEVEDLDPDAAAEPTLGSEVSENSNAASTDVAADGVSEVSATENMEVAEEAASAAATPMVTMLEFAAVSEVVDFGYGKYITQSGSRELVSMALSIMERNEAGEVPVLQIEGSASFVPVKNKRAYETNEQLAKMRAEKARDAMIMELAQRGLQVGVDYQIVLEWGVAGPDYRGDAVDAADTYRNYQYAKFSLSRTLVEQRR